VYNSVVYFFVHILSWDAPPFRRWGFLFCSKVYQKILLNFLVRGYLFLLCFQQKRRRFFWPSKNTSIAKTHSL
jgi:hypothetical protein